MNTSAGWELYQRNPRQAPKSAAQNTASSPLPDVQDLEVVGDDPVPADVHQDRVRDRGDPHQPGGKAVEAVRQVHGVGRSTITSAAKGIANHPRSMTKRLKKAPRDGHLGIAREIVENKPDQQAAAVCSPNFCSPSGRLSASSPP